MASSITPVNLGSAVPGTLIGPIDISRQYIKPTIAQSEAGLTNHLVLFNESGVGFLLTFGGGDQYEIPAGGWTQPFALYDSDVSFTILPRYIIPNAPVSQLLGTVYAPYERPEQTVTLGNSPIGLVGSPGLSVTQLINDGNAPPTQIIESTPNDQGVSSESWNNDASGFEKVLSAGNLRTVRATTRGNTGATHAIVQFGDTNDAGMTTVYGSLQGGQAANIGVLTGTSAIFNGEVRVTGNTSIANIQGYEIQDQKSGGHDWSLFLDADNNLHFFDSVSGTDITIANTVGGASFPNRVIAGAASPRNTQSFAASATNDQGSSVVAINLSATSGQNADILDINRQTNQPALFRFGIDSSNNLYIYDNSHGKFMLLGNANAIGFDNSLTFTTGSGKWNIAGPDKLTTGNQYLGKTGHKTTGGGGNFFGVMARYPMLMTNTPSSITLGPADSSSNASNIQAIDIDIGGFFFQFTDNGVVGPLWWYGQYTTVGNCIRAVDAKAQTFDHHCDRCDTLRTAIPFTELDITKDAQLLKPGQYHLGYRCISPECQKNGITESFNTQSSAEDATTDTTGQHALVRQLISALGLPLA